MEGKTPLHIAIENQHQVIIALLMSHPLVKLGLQDRHRVTPFAAAMLTRNNKAAQAILDREPNAAEQVGGGGGEGVGGGPSRGWQGQSAGMTPSGEVVTLFWKLM